jgi:hypothetical protein
MPRTPVPIDDDSALASESFSSLRAQDVSVILGGETVVRPRDEVDGLARGRPRRSLWRSVGDRLGQAAVWCGEAFGDREGALALAADVLAAPTPLRARAGFVLRGDQAYRPRTGCCLSHRCAGGSTCDDCPLLHRGAGA